MSIINIFATPAQPKTVDSVMEAFNATIIDLQEVQHQQELEASKAQEEIAAAQLRLTAAAEEAGRAARVRDKLLNLLGA